MTTLHPETELNMAPEDMVFALSVFDPAQSPLAKGDITPAQVEGLYSMALSHYNAGHYAQADTLFQMLCFYTYNDARFWMGLGGCRQALGKLPAAAEAYCMAARADTFASPDPLLFTAMCLLRHGDQDDAAHILRLVLEMGAQAPQEHAECLNKARQLLQNLEADAAGLKGTQA